MTQPMDPHSDGYAGNSEMCWGAGMFPPGIADNEGQSKHQDDFGENLDPKVNSFGAHNDNYARAVADRRTDTTDPESERDFETLGNIDRYGAAPPLVREKPQPNVSARQDVPKNTTPRAW